MAVGRARCSSRRDRGTSSSRRARACSSPCQPGCRRHRVSALSAGAQPVTGPFLCRVSLLWRPRPLSLPLLLSREARRCAYFIVCAPAEQTARTNANSTRHDSEDPFPGCCCGTTAPGGATGAAAEGAPIGCRSGWRSGPRRGARHGRGDGGAWCARPWGAGRTWRHSARGVGQLRHPLGSFHAHFSTYLVPCLSEADWCLQSDVVPDSCLQAPAAGHGSQEAGSQAQAEASAGQGAVRLRGPRRR